MFTRRRLKDPLEDVLLTWPDGTPWTVRECLRSTECKGITGSGKSSGARDTLVRAILRHPKSTIDEIPATTESSHQHRSDTNDEDASR